MHYKPFMFVFFNTNPNFLHNLLKQQENKNLKIHHLLSLVILLIKPHLHYDRFYRNDWKSPLKSAIQVSWEQNVR